jgi:hypothetical protein
MKRSLILTCSSLIAKHTECFPDHVTGDKHVHFNTSHRKFDVKVRKLNVSCCIKARPVSFYIRGFLCVCGGEGGGRGHIILCKIFFLQHEKGGHLKNMQIKSKMYQPSPPVINDQSLTMTLK